MDEELDTVLLLTHITYEQSQAIVAWIIRQQEDDRLEFCQAMTEQVSALDATLAGFHTMRVYGLGD